MQNYKTITLPGIGEVSEWKREHPNCTIVREQKVYDGYKIWYTERG